jgi:N-acetylglucosamine kinase-like BadF-type ATPase
MSKPFLVADSGGTQTDWCYVSATGSREYFTTISFHPSNWGDDFVIEMDAFWKSKSHLKDVPVYFYGAGCLNDSNKATIKDYFTQWGFQQVSVKSDVEAACQATIGDSEGVVAILGTGSVVCDWSGSSIVSIKGGFGYLIGDEGSGYYFGKLLISKLLKLELSTELTSELTTLLGTRAELLLKVYGTNGKAFISSLGSFTKELKIRYSEIDQIHEENLQMFIDNYLVRNEFSKVSIVGSYGFHNQDLLKKLLLKNNLLLNNCVQYPIERLTDYIEKSTL